MSGIRGIVIGASAGGLNALRVICRDLPKGFSPFVVAVVHMGESGFDAFVDDMAQRCPLPVEEARDKQVIEGGKIYFAPPNYHLLVEKEGTFALSLDEKENHSRPSIDVLFETASEALGSSLMGVVLTGANTDGARGARFLKQQGGLLVVEDPESAEMAMMPSSAIELGHPDAVVPLEKISEKMLAFARGDA